VCSVCLCGEPQNYKKHHHHSINWEWGKLMYFLNPKWSVPVTIDLSGEPQIFENEENLGDLRKGPFLFLP